MARPLFALLGVLVLFGAAVGPAVAAQTDAGNDAAEAPPTEAGNAPVDSGENATFGQQVSAYVHTLQGTTNGTGIGPAVSTFVVANNPGNAPAHAGGPGGPNASENDTRRGPPAFVQAVIGGPGNGDEGGEAHRPPANVTGPPEHAGGQPDHAGGADGANESEDDGNESVDDETPNDENADAGDEADDERGGPPAHAGPGGNGPGGPDDSDSAEQAESTATTDG